MSSLNWGMKGCGVFLLWVTVALSLPAQTLTTFHMFNGTDGSGPAAALVQATNGDLYGTTVQGGANNTCYGTSCGTVFKITPGGTLTTVYNFCSQNGCVDGIEPEAPLVLGTDGNLYGTTIFGGTGTACVANCGTVFRLTPAGTLTTLHSFDSMDGANPYAGLVQATDGNFYGTTFAGGTDTFGTVFKITTTGQLTTLYNFSEKDGSGPTAKLVQGTDGNFYGTTAAGGTNGDGTVFKITPRGTLTTLYSFCSQQSCLDGFYPFAGLVEGLDGDFYGAAAKGGNTFNCQIGCGTIFKITRTGVLTVLHQFDGTDGANSQAAMLQATDGNFYGTTYAGGGDNSGTIFEMTLGGMVTTLYSFCSVFNGICEDGLFPVAALVQDTNGKFYGATFGAPSNSDGTIFGLSVGLGPFVETNPASAKVGASVKILGTGLTGATGVTFNGAAAVFTVVSSSLITTSVPAGATSGKVRVVTPSRTLSSNEAFRVKS